MQIWSSRVLGSTWPQKFQLKSVVCSFPGTLYSLRSQIPMNRYFSDKFTLPSCHKIQRVKKNTPVEEDRSPIKEWLLLCVTLYLHFNETPISQVLNDNLYPSYTPDMQVLKMLIVFLITWTLSWLVWYSWIYFCQVNLQQQKVLGIRPFLRKWMF